MTRHACLTIALKALSVVGLVGIAGCAGGQTDPVTSTAPAPATPASTDAPTEAADAKRTRVDTSFTSAALGVDKQLVVFLPPGYETSGKRYPVIYMLHGIGSYQESWARVGISQAADDVGLEAILVLPDGDDGFYVNWESKVDYDACLKSKRAFGSEPSMKTYCVRDAKYADYITRDLVGHIDQRYRTIASRDGRAIGGLSMGGYGALVSAFSNPDLYSAVASHAGVASLRYSGPDPFVAGKAVQFTDPKTLTRGVPRFGAHFERIFSNELSAWTARDPVALAPSLADGQLAIYLDCGTDDIFRLNNGAAHLSETLNAAGVTHEFHLIEGGKHDGAFWRAQIDDSLRFFAKHLTSPTN